MDHKSDHDLLIELNKTVELMFNQIQKSHQDHMKEDATNFTEIKSVAKAAHSRLDKIFSMKDKFLGGITVISFLFGMGISLLSVLNK